MSDQRIAHSSCPKKRDIRPPEFRLVETLNTSAGPLRTYQCDGCGTQIIALQSQSDVEGPGRG